MNATTVPVFPETNKLKLETEVANRIEPRLFNNDRIGTMLADWHISKPLLGQGGCWYSTAVRLKLVHRVPHKARTSISIVVSIISEILTFCLGIVSSWWALTWLCDSLELTWFTVTSVSKFRDEELGYYLSFPRSSDLIIANYPSFGKLKLLDDLWYLCKVIE